MLSLEAANAGNGVNDFITPATQGPPQQGEQIGPPLHDRPQCEQPSSAVPLLAVHAPVCWQLQLGSVVGSSRAAALTPRPIGKVDVSRSQRSTT